MSRNYVSPRLIRTVLCELGLIGLAAGCSPPADDSPDNDAPNAVPNTPEPNPPVASMPNPSPSPAAPSLVAPSVSGDVYALDIGNGTSLVANGTTGRVTQFNFGGVNLLTDESVNSLNYGASFWTAPQSTWGWPPPLDQTTYSHQVDGSQVLFTSAATMQSGETVSITKRFSADAIAGQFFLEYTIKNEGAAAINVAPWEVSRHRANGLTFYPTGSSVTKAELTTTDVSGVTWLDYETAGLSGSGKKNATDGAEGWLAHVDDGVLVLKSFTDIPAGSEAPDEGEIEIYVDGDRAYVELEQQGALVTLEPGAVSAPWRVVWQVSVLPDDVTASVGSEALVAHVRSLLQ